MPNPYFKFKQFTVHHDLCSMKVGIDGVLLGCWATHHNPKNILDIGTGSGLIALMLAQRYDAQIYAIDIETNAILQSQYNIDQSPWKSRISALELSLQEYTKHTDTKYDLIVSNPPYFIDSLNSPNSGRTTARHTNTLSHEELLFHSKQMLTDTGIISIILPSREGNLAIRLAHKIGLNCIRKTNVYPKPGVEAKRLLMEFSPVYQPISETNLYIETDIRHEYSPEFTKLAAPFYLKL